MDVRRPPIIVPPIVSALAIYRMWLDLKLLDTYVGMILAHTILAGSFATYDIYITTALIYLALTYIVVAIFRKVEFRLSGHPRARLCRAVGPERLEGVNQRSAERPETIAASAPRAFPRSPRIRAPLKPFASREKAR